MRRDGIASESERQAGARLTALLDKLTASGAAVAVIATSSRPGALDAAIRRPGRLGLEVPCSSRPSSGKQKLNTNGVYYFSACCGVTSM